MKKIFLSIVLILALANQVRADTKATVASSLIGLGVSSHVASYLSDQITGNATLVNNQFLQARNAADNANLDVIRVTSGDATQINTKASTNMNFSVNGTTEFQVSDDVINLTGAATEVQGNGGSGSFGIRATQVSLPLSGETISVQEATPASACMGVATPNGTTPVTVTTSCAATGARVIYFRVGAVANMASISTTTAPNGTSFSFASTGGTDTTASSVGYLIIKESA